MALLGQRLVPPFQWRGLIALAVVVGVVSELVWYEYCHSSYVLGFPFRSPPRIVTLPVRYAIAGAAAYWFLRRSRRWLPYLAAVVIAVLASELTYLGRAVSSRELGWGAVLFTDTKVFWMQYPRDLGWRFLYVLPGAVMLRLLVAALLRVDEWEPGQCPKCGYAIGDDSRIAKCPECGTPRELFGQSKGDRTARAWIALQKWGRILAILLVGTLVTLAVSRYVSRGRPLLAFWRAFDAGIPRQTYVFVGGSREEIQQNGGNDHKYFLAVSRTDPAEPRLIYLFNPRQAEGMPVMRVMVGVPGKYRYGVDVGSPLVLVNLDARLAHATIEQGGLPKALAADLRRRAELVEWKLIGRADAFIGNGPSLEPHPYFAPEEPE